MLGRLGMTAVDAAKVSGRNCRRLVGHTKMGVPLSAVFRKFESPDPRVIAYIAECMLDDMARVTGRGNYQYCDKTNMWTMQDGANESEILEALDSRLRQARDGICPGADAITVSIPEGSWREFRGGAAAIVVFENVMPPGLPEEIRAVAEYQEARA